MAAALHSIEFTDEEQVYVTLVAEIIEADISPRICRELE
jgi:hypothetical protein